MSYISVDSYWIVGEPVAAANLVRSVVNWTSEQTGFQPSKEQWDKIDGLIDELTERYSFGKRDFAVFATELVDATLNRIYPFLATFAKDAGIRIDLDRKSFKDSESGDAVVYTINSEPIEGWETDPTEGKAPPIDENPYPLPPGIDPSTEAFPPGTPGNPYGPTFPGVPYDLFNQLEREPQPYPMRNENPLLSGAGEGVGTGNGTGTGTGSGSGSGSGTGTGTGSGSGTGTGSGSGSGNGGEGEGEGGEGGEGEGEGGGGDEPMDELPVGDDIAGLLKKILAAIVDQGQRTRDTIVEAYASVSSILLAVESGIGDVVDAVAKQTSDIVDSIEGSADSLGDAIKESNKESVDVVVKGIDDAADEVVKAIESELSEEERPEEGVLGALQSILSDVIDGASDTLGAAISIVGDAVDGLIDGFSTVSSAIIGSTGNLLTTVADWFTMDEDDLRKWICKFYSLAETLKDDCPVMQRNL
jgi:hypothetical protein